MRKLKLLFLIIFIVLGNIGCNTISKPILSLDIYKIDIFIGEETQINPKVSNIENPKFVYQSIDTDIATVDSNGNIYGKSIGKTLIKITVEGYSNLEVTLTINVLDNISKNSLSLEGLDTVKVGEQIVLKATDTNTTDNIVYWDTLDTSILTVNQEGVVTGVGVGIAKIKIYSYVSVNVLEKEISVIEPDAKSIHINELLDEKISLSSDIILSATVLPKEAKQEVVWESLNTNIADIDQDGRLIIYKAGEVVIRAKVENTIISDLYVIKIENSPIDLFKLLHMEEPLFRPEIMYWAYEDPAKNKSYDLYGSVSYYYFSNIDIDKTSYWLDSNRENFDKRTFENPEYIVIHDTWNPSGGAKANAALITNPGNVLTSWHFTVGNDGIYQSLDELQYGKHAGDGGRDFLLYDTNIKATVDNPELSISDDGYWTFNGTKSVILAPLAGSRIATINDITDSGIYTEVKDGNYYIGSTYFNTTYNRICNTGGNSRGIGIETTMNFGSDLYLTWQKTAKLVAELLVRHNLDVSRVRQHNFFSGKDCPRTMRKADLWNYFLEMVEAEYKVLNILKDYTITFISNNPDYIDNTGRLISLPDKKITVSYTIKISNNQGILEERTFFTELNP